MTRKKNKVPKEIIKNQIVDIKKDFKISPRIESHQIRLPIPKQLVRDLDLEEKWRKKKKIKLLFNADKKELRFKI